LNEVMHLTKRLCYLSSSFCLPKL